jgi:hypothetical protein
MTKQWTKPQLWEYVLILHGRKLKIAELKGEKAENLFRKVHLRFEQILDKFNNFNH